MGNNMKNDIRLRNSVHKQMLINRLQTFIPADTLDIIKGFLFYDAVISTQRNYHSTITKQIGQTPWSTRDIDLWPFSSYTFFFWVHDENHNTCNQFQCEFCLTCGEYVYTDFLRIKCLC